MKKKKLQVRKNENNLSQLDLEISLKEIIKQDPKKLAILLKEFLKKEKNR